VWQEIRSRYSRLDPARLAEIQQSPKKRMALVFKWYFAHTTLLALNGSSNHRVDYQVHCGPAMGAFNQWVKGTDLEQWKNRHVADIAERIMHGAALLLTQRLNAMTRRSHLVNGSARPNERAQRRA